MDLESNRGGIILTLEIYIQKIDLVVSKISEAYGQVIHLFKKASNIILLVNKIYSRTIYLKYDKYDRLQKNPVYKLLRFMTWPWHWIFIFTWMYLKKRKNHKILYDEPGVHILIGPPGSGKSSLMYMLMERLRILEGKPSYINSSFEKPRTSEEGDYLFRYHQLYKFSDFWRNRNTVMEPNEDIYAAMFIDEGHQILNYRENGTTDYNDRFIPFMKYAVEVRHKIGKIFFSTQMGKADTQLMNTCQSISAPKANIGFKYDDWLFESGLFKFNIKGFKIDVYDKDINGEKSSKPKYSFYLKNEWADFDYFNTYAMKDSNIHIPKHYPTNMIKGRFVQ